MPGVLVLEWLVEVLALCDRDRGAGARDVQHVFAADAVGGARVSVARRIEVGTRQEEAVEGELLALTLQQSGDPVRLAAGEVAVEQDTALVGQRLRGTERG